MSAARTLSEYWYLITGLAGALLILVLNRHAARKPNTSLARHWKRLRYAAYASVPAFGVLLLIDVALSTWAPEYTYHDYFFSQYFFPALVVACWLAAPYLMRWVPLDRDFGANTQAVAPASSRAELKANSNPPSRTGGARHPLVFFMVLFTVIALFVTASTLAFSPGTEGTVGVLLVVAGLITMFFSRNIAENFSTVSWIGISVRPLTMQLWGAGIAIVGASYLFLPT